MVLGRFWYSRFRLLRTLIPKTLLLLRPRFFLENTWVDFDELYAPMAQLAQTASAWGAAPRQARLLGMC